MASFILSWNYEYADPFKEGTSIFTTCFILWRVIWIEISELLLRIRLHARAHICLSQPLQSDLKGSWAFYIGRQNLEEWPHVWWMNWNTMKELQSLFQFNNFISFKHEHLFKIPNYSFPGRITFPHRFFPFTNYFFLFRKFHSLVNHIYLMRGLHKH